VDPSGLGIIPDVCDVCDIVVGVGKKISGVVIGVGKKVSDIVVGVGRKVGNAKRAMGNRSLITFKVAGSDKKRYTTVYSWEDFEDWMDVLKLTGHRVSFFEFVGHSAGGAGLIMGNDVLGIGPTIFGAYPEKGIEDWYGINNYAPVLQSIFDPHATIELEGCYTAEPGTTTIGRAFKKILPDATVKGWTGPAQPWLVVWGTHAAVIEWGDGIIKIFPESEW